LKGNREAIVAEQEVQKVSLEPAADDKVVAGVELGVLPTEFSIEPG
jgi:hypothetical protein